MLYPMFLSVTFSGFGDRLLSEVKKLAPKDVKIRVSVCRHSICSVCLVPIMFACPGGVTSLIDLKTQELAKASNYLLCEIH